MFCINCGGKIPERANFCTGCGSPVKAVPAPMPQAPRPVAPLVVPSSGPSIGSAGQIVATPLKAERDGKCSWCGSAVDAGQNACPKCGAALNLSTATTRSGWAKLPGRKDMAKLQFGNSVCQIEGKYVPVADLKLAPEDSIYFTHHVLLWKDPQVNVTAMSMKGAWKRMMGGLPLIMTQAQGPGHIAFSQDSPGELIPLPMQHGQAIDVREHLFLAATGNVAYDWFQTHIWFQTRNGNETETHYPLGQIMDRFSATGAPGLLLLHAAGNVFVRELAPGQTILVKPTALVFKDPTVNMDLYYETPTAGFGAWLSSNNGYLWLRLTGPGRVAIQSVFDRVEGEERYTGGSRNYGPSTGSGGLMGDLFGEIIGSVLE
jgi:uncharacterized protein (AIM24 family)